MPQSDVQLDVISQEWLPPTPDEPSLNLGIRLRLANLSNKRASYLVFDRISVYPNLNHYSRDIGTAEWKSIAFPGKFPGTDQKMLLLEPGMTIEFDAVEASIKGVERRFSVLAQLDNESTPKEIYSTVFRPLVKR